MRASIEGEELLPSHWPSAERNPGSVFEIQRSKRKAIPAPVVRGSAKIAESCLMKWGVIAARIDSSVKFLRSQIKLKPSAFDEGHTKRLPNEFPCEGDTGRASTDDADFGLDDRAVWERTTIKVHFQ